MTYIHELAEWPEFTWDMQALAKALAAVRHKQGRHLGKMEALGFELRTEASLTALTNEVVKSSAIEGESLDTDEVRSSIARKLGLDVAGLPKPGREVEGIVEMMVDATQNFDQLLTPERLYGWHAALFPTSRSGMVRITVGALRRGESGPMQVVSGPMGKERVHFQAPDAGRLGEEMERFLVWFNRSPDVDPVLKAAVAHLWFVTIHPFDDGNGRIARALGDYVMLVHGFYYDVIMTDYKDHYLDSLEACSLLDAKPLSTFLEFSYLETLGRVAGFFSIVEQEDKRR